MATTTQKVLLVILAFFIPPLAVGIKAGLGWPLVINIIPTLLFWVPGFIHALIVIFSD